MSKTAMTRRGFLGGVAAFGMAAAMRSEAREQPGAAKSSEAASGRPLIISTWKQGKPANERAAEVLRSEERRVGKECRL